MSKVNACFQYLWEILLRLPCSYTRFWQHLMDLSYRPFPSVQIIAEEPKFSKFGVRCTCSSSKRWSRCTQWRWWWPWGIWCSPVEKNFNHEYSYKNNTLETPLKCKRELWLKWSFFWAQKFSSVLHVIPYSSSFSKPS